MRPWWPPSYRAPASGISWTFSGNPGTRPDWAVPWHCIEYCKHPSLRDVVDTPDEARGRARHLSVHASACHLRGRQRRDCGWPVPRRPMPVFALPTTQIASHCPALIWPSRPVSLSSLQAGNRSTGTVDMCRRGRWAPARGRRVFHKTIVTTPVPPERPLLLPLLFSTTNAGEFAKIESFAVRSILSFRV